MIELVLSDLINEEQCACILQSVQKVFEEVLEINVDPMQFRISIQENSRYDVSIMASVFPSGSSRARRIAVQKVKRDIFEQLRIDEEHISVEITAPPQERRFI